MPNKFWSIFSMKFFVGFRRFFAKKRSILKPDLQNLVSIRQKTTIIKKLLKNWNFLPKFSSFPTKIEINWTKNPVRAEIWDKICALFVRYFCAIFAFFDGYFIFLRYFCAHFSRPVKLLRAFFFEIVHQCTNPAK